ncbi:hypothetical protein XENTR_v10010949 [Xenopus tropicalis]|uniref:Interferon-induced transmembrane protein 3 n=1 Tax=Xenopus tropicalis TaxID=8364 RepID=F7B6X6_XENTR|nr:interferon induced transmembrane protein 3 [Xenopus tropicalis]AAH89694.1 MGC107971 protein [Xenopus tropicalis]KAE8606972.1 hypothetical protein XENTR_v10010949 [Xenopus tropicalis]|eukprot:NP_001015758.1 interferon induced transmembrane protein 3 [Xenopus tropicalis]
MENSSYGRQQNSAGSPPLYGSPGYEPLREEMSYRGGPGVQVQSTILTIDSDGPPVRDHLVWSIFNTVYFNFCCLGFFALIFSVKSRDRKLIGDRSGAMSYAGTARGLNITATILTIVTFIVLIILAVTGVITAVRTVQDHPYPYPNNPWGN